MRRPFLHVFAVLLSLSLLTGSATAQPKALRARFTTVDGVEINGHFYEGGKKGGVDTPVVMLLHAYESNSLTKDWINLAESLQKSGYAVLSFDFRGHGDSTTVADPALFWSNPTNRNFIKSPNPKRVSIEAKDFKPEYRTALINDIASAKAWLDRKNDNKQCNTGATILIGAEEGATLGAIWLNSEWYRFRMVQKGFVLVNVPEPEGADVCACVWLSMSTKLGAGATTSIPVHSTLLLPARYQATPMLFVHGDGDAVGKALATKLDKDLKDPKAPKGKFKFTGALEVKGTKLTGAGLLKTPGASGDITTWLDEVSLKGREWVDREFAKTQYYWINVGKRFPARISIGGGTSWQPDPMNMMFDTYRAYIGGR
jgi:hypothetical protein